MVNGTFELGIPSRRNFVFAPQHGLLYRKHLYNCIETSATLRNIIEKINKKIRIRNHDENRLNVSFLSILGFLPRKRSA